MPELQTILNDFSRYLYAQRGFGNVTVSNHIAAIRRLAPIVSTEPTQLDAEELIASICADDLLWHLHL